MAEKAGLDAILEVQARQMLMRVLFIVLVVSSLAVVGVAVAIYARVRKRVDAKTEESSIHVFKGEDHG